MRHVIQTLDALVSFRSSSGLLPIRCLVLPQFMLYLCTKEASRMSKFIVASTKWN